MLRLAYNTNGLQSHRLEDALDLLAEAGYQGVALTLDHMHLDPLRADGAAVQRVGELLRARGLACELETGARFVLDPRRKHLPGLCDPDPGERRRRVELLRRSLEIGAALGAEAVVLPAGPREAGRDPAQAQGLLREGLAELLARAGSLGQVLAFEPEPGHWVATQAEWQALAEDLPDLRLALDVCHVGVEAEEGSVAEAVERWAGRLAVVHLEDAPRGRHEHLPFGEGALDLDAVLGALERIEFRGLCAVELSRHSHAAHELVGESLAWLRAREGRSEARGGSRGVS